MRRGRLPALTALVLIGVVLDNCPGGPPGPGGDAWPLDIDMNREIDVTSDVFTYRGKIGCIVSQDPTCKRLDLVPDGEIDVTGDVFEYRGMIGATCT